MTTERLSLTTLTAGQDGAELDHNEALQQLDALAHPAILDRDLTAPPATNANGDTYLVAATATGDWVDQDGNLALYYDGWLFAPPAKGMVAWIADEDVWVLYDGVGWRPMPVATWTVALDIDNGGANQTAAVVRHQSRDTQTFAVPIPRACRLAEIAFTSYHVNGSDPGDWTLSCYVNGSGSSSADVVWEWNASDATAETTVQRLPTPLALARGDYLDFDAAGPSCDDLDVNIVLVFESSAAARSVTVPATASTGGVLAPIVA